MITSTTCHSGIEMGSQPSRSNRSHQDLLLPRPEESKNSSNSSREFSLPTVTPSTISPSLIGKSGFAISRNSRYCSRANQNPEPRWVNESTLLFFSGISLSGNRYIRCRGFHAPRIPEPRTPMARALSPRHVTSSLLSIGNRGIAISLFAIPLHLKTPNAESRPHGI
jgi:hypothetical protein